MEKIRIVADSCSDLTPEIISELDIEILPIYYILNDVIYANDPFNPPMSIKEFYSLMKEGKEFKTSQINTEKTMDTFEQLVQKGYKILYLCFSSALSGTYNTVCTIKSDLEKKYKDCDIYVLDSALASISEGLFVYEVAKKSKEGLSFSKLIEFAENLKTKIHSFFTIDDINGLKRGGRLTATKALVAKLLNLKPCLRIDITGRLLPFKAARGTQNAIQTLFNSLIESYDTGNSAPLNEIWIGHADNFELAEILKEKIETHLKEKTPNIKILYIGPVIGTHVGPNMLMIGFVGKKDNN